MEPIVSVFMLRRSLLLLAIPASVHAQESEREGREAIPEPLLTESVTDIDAANGGEVELGVNGQTLHALYGGARAWQASAEIE